MVNGNIMLVFSLKEISSGAKLFQEYMKQNEMVKVKAISIDKDILNADALDFVAKLPTKQEALTIFATTLLTPLKSFMNTLTATVTKFGMTLQAYKEKLEEKE